MIMKNFDMKQQGCCSVKKQDNFGLNTINEQLIDTVGYIHNEALLYLSENDKFPNINIKELYLLVANFVSNEMRNINSYYTGISIKDVEEIIKKYHQKPEKAIEGLTFEGKLTDFSKEFIYKIIEESEKIKFPQYVSIELTGLKNIILLNSKLTNHEKTLLLGAVTIGIYSNSFWSYQSNNPNSPWKRVSGGVVERDIVGFITGCYACMPGGPAGCIFCGLIGAIVSSFLEK